MKISSLIDKYYDKFLIDRSDFNSFLNESIHSKDSVIGIINSDEYLKESIKNNSNINLFSLDDYIIKRYELSKLKEIFFVDSEIENLKNIRYLKRVLEYFYDSLSDDGYIVLRVVNFQKVEDLNILNMPIIDVEEFNINISKSYTKSDDNEIETRFKIEDHNGNILSEEANKVFGVKKQDLIYLLSNIGYNEIEMFGNFDQQKFNEKSSNFLILRARKRKNILKDSDEYEEYTDNYLKEKKCCSANNNTCNKGCNKNSCCKRNIEII